MTTPNYLHRINFGKKMKLSQDVDLECGKSCETSSLKDNLKGNP